MKPSHMMPIGMIRGLEMSRPTGTPANNSRVSAAMKLMRITDELAARHYAVHKDRPFYPGLVKFMTSGPVVALAMEGIDAIAICRKMMGATFGSDAEPGTIRGDFGVSRSFNLVHGSDSPETAAIELELFFPDGFEAYELDAFRWIYDPEEELGK